MGSPVDMATMNREEVNDKMEAVLSIDTTKGNSVINVNGFAVSQTVKEGYILRYSSDILDIMQRTTGKTPHTFGVSMQDITPYGNGLFHLNSILQPATATAAPVIGRGSHHRAACGRMCHGSVSLCRCGGDRTFCGGSGQGIRCPVSAAFTMSGNSKPW